MKQATMACRSLVLQSLWGLVQEVLHESATSLENQLRASTQAEQRAVLHDAVALSSVGAELLGRAWIDAFMQQFDDALNATERSASVSTGGATSALGTNKPVLSLVSDDELHDTLERDRMAHRVTSRIDAQAIAAVRARLAELAGRAEFAENDHPLSPARLFEALDQAATQREAARDVRMLLLEEVALDLPARWEALIQDVNALLLAQGVMPRLRPVLTRKEVAAGAVASRAEEGGRSAAEPRAHRFSMHGFAAKAGSNAPASLGLSGEGPQVDQLQGALLGARSGRAGAHQEILQVLADDQQLGALGRALEPVRRPMLDSLSELQRQSQGELSAVSLDSIAEQLHRNGTVLDQVTADIVSMVFDYIDADRRLADSVKRQLLRLQVVAIKAALLDRAFFARRQHPLRRLIDVISDAGADPEADLEPASVLLTGIRTVIDDVIGHFDTALEVFDDAILKVQSLVEAETERHRIEREKAEQEAARREALAVAGDEARAVLTDRIDGQTPEEVSRFLLEHWSRLMVRARMAADAALGARHWEVSLRTAELLLWSCLPKQAEEIARLAQILPVMLRAIQQGMQAIDLPQPDRDAFLSFLMKTHTRETSLARRRPPQSEGLAPALIRMSADGVVRFDPLVRTSTGSTPITEGGARSRTALQGSGSAQGAILSALVRGGRYEVPTPAGARQAKLAWISPARRLFIFSAHPEFNLTMAAEEVEQHLRGGQLRPVDPSPSVQNILEQLIQPEPTR
ncbi:MAG: DUF1631 family protein [Burkholderiaceae bacterium]